MKIKSVFLVLFAVFLVCPSVFGFESTAEKDAFDAICKLYDETKGTTAVISEAQKFNKQYKKSDFAWRVDYIIAHSYGDTQESVNNFLQITKKYKNKDAQIASLLMVAQIYFNLGKYEMSLGYYEQLALQYQNHFMTREILYGLSQSQIALKKWPEAEKTLNKLVQLDPFYEKQEKVIYAQGLILFNKKIYEEALAKFNQLSDSRALYYQGRCLEKLQRYIPATVPLKQILSKFAGSPFSEDARFVSADCFFRTADYSLAITEFEEFLKIYPESYLYENALFRVGCSYYLQKKFPEAVARFRTFVEDYPKSEFAPYAKYMLGESFVQQNDFVRASFAYGEVLKDYPSSQILPNTYYKLGWCYTKQKSYESAIDMFDRIITGYPKHGLVPFSLLLQAENYSKIGNLDRAIECYRKVLDLPDKKEDITEVALFLMTRTFYDAKRNNDIVSSFQYILNALPPSKSEWRSYTYLLVAEAYYQMSSYTESGRIYDNVMKNFPYTKPAALAQEGKAWVLFKVKDYDQAQKKRQEFAEDITVKRTAYSDVSNEFEMGNIYFNQKKYVESLDAFEKFVAKYPDNELIPEAIFNIGRCYYRLEYYTKAIQTWESLIARFARHQRVQEAMTQIADTYFRAQKYSEAIQAYKRIIAAYPSTDPAKMAQLRIAQSQYNSMNDEAAIMEFEKFLNLYPEDKETESALEGIIMAAYRLSESGSATDLDLKVLRSFVENYPKSKLAGSAQYRIAQRFYEQKKFLEAADEFKKVVNYFDSSGQYVPNSYFFSAESYYYAKDYEQAVPLFRMFTKNFPKHESARGAYLHFANSLFYLEKYGEAAATYQELVRISPKKDEITETAHLNSALCLKKAEKWQDSVTAYESFIKEYPSSQNYSSTMIELFGLYEVLRQYDNAIAVAEEIISKTPQGDPLIPELMYKIGELDIKQGNIQTGIDELLALLDYKPSSNAWRLSAVARVAQEYENQKKWSSAISMYKEIISSSNETKWVSAAQERIEAINQMQQQ